MKTLKDELIKFANSIIEKSYKAGKYEFESKFKGVFDSDMYAVLYDMLKDNIEGLFRINLVYVADKEFKLSVEVVHHYLYENRLFAYLNVRNFDIEEALNGAGFISMNYFSDFRLNYLVKDLRGEGFNNVNDLLGYQVTYDGTNYLSKGYCSKGIELNYVMCDEKIAKAINEAYKLAKDWCYTNYFEILGVRDGLHKYCKLTIKQPSHKLSSNININILLKERNNFIRDILKTKIPYKIDKMRISPTVENDYEIEIYFK